MGGRGHPRSRERNVSQINTPILVMMLAIASSFTVSAGHAQGHTAKSPKILHQPAYSKATNSSAAHKPQAPGSQKNAMDEPVPPDVFQQGAIPTTPDTEQTPKEVPEPHKAAASIQKGLDHSRNAYYNQNNPNWAAEHAVPNNRDRYLPSAPPKLDTAADKPALQQEPIQSELTHQSRSQDMSIPEQERGQQNSKSLNTPMARATRRGQFMIQTTTRRMLNRGYSLIKL